MRPSSEDPKASQETILTSLLGDRMESIQQILRLLALAEQRMEMRVVVAPCNGSVVEIAAYEGSTIDEYVYNPEDDVIAGEVEANIPANRSSQRTRPTTCGPRTSRGTSARRTICTATR